MEKNEAETDLNTKQHCLRMITDMTRSVEVGQANLMQRLTGHSWQRIGVEMRGTVTPRQIPRYYKLRYYIIANCRRIAQ